jgi:penicillin-binding protein 2
VEMTPEQYNQIVSGLLGVTQSGEGTAAASWRANPTAWPMAGKTGTAQVKGKADTALFAGWGPVLPAGIPQYAIAVVVPEAGFGGDVAAPLAFRILAPASRGELVPACTLAAIAAANDSRRDVGSGGPG